MLTFNESNVDNRPRQHVRGRVIVFTTSRVVEYLTESRTQSFPLYSHSDAYASGYGLSFMVELDGYLTFDVNAFVKIRELAPFNAPFYDPTAFAVVKAADPFISLVVSASPNRYGNIMVAYSTESGSTNTFEMVSYSGSSPSVFAVGSRWLGIKGYLPNWHYVYENGF